MFDCVAYELLCCIGNWKEVDAEADLSMSNDLFAAAAAAGVVVVVVAVVVVFESVDAMSMLELKFSFVRPRDGGGGLLGSFLPLFDCGRVSSLTFTDAVDEDEWYRGMGAVPVCWGDFLRVEWIIECVAEGFGLRTSFGDVALEINEEGFSLAMEAAAARAVVDDEWLRSFHRFLLFCEDGERVDVEDDTTDEAREDGNSVCGDFASGDAIFRSEGCL